MWTIIRNEDWSIHSLPRIHLWLLFFCGECACLDVASARFFVVYKIPLGKSWFASKRPFIDLFQYSLIICRHKNGVHRSEHSFPLAWMKDTFLLLYNVHLSCFLISSDITKNRSSLYVCLAGTTMSVRSIDSDYQHPNQSYHPNPSLRLPSCLSLVHAKLCIACGVSLGEQVHVRAFFGVRGGVETWTRSQQNKTKAHPCGHTSADVSILKTQNKKGQKALLTTHGSSWLILVSTSSSVSGNGFAIGFNECCDQRCCKWFEALWSASAIGVRL